MIAMLQGTIELIDVSNVIIDVNGVGYKVTVSRDVLAKIGKIGEKIKVFTYTHVREDILELYGFLAPEDLKLFEHLISVSGIGPKTALGIFSLNSSKDIIQAIISGNVEFFSATPRLGTKNAQKIIIELRGKFGETGILSSLDGMEKGSDEILAALKTFGFTSREIQEALKNVHGKANSTEEKIKLALKYLGK